MNENEQNVTEQETINQTSEQEIQSEQKAEGKTLEEIIAVHAEERKKRIEDALAQKTALLERAKEIVASQDVQNAKNKWNQLVNEWKEIHIFRVNEEKALGEQLKTVKKELDELYEKQKETNKKAKEAIINEANEALKKENFKEVNSILNGLLDRYKAIGSAGKAEDEELWNGFKQIRDTFYENRQKFFEDQANQQVVNKEKKQNLIDQTRAISISVDENWKKLSEKLAGMMDEWKTIGFAGTDVNESLWKEFNSARKVLFDQRTAAFADINEQREKVAKVKEELIAEAKRIADTKDYSKENSEAMKKLDVQWKEAGSAGKEKEDDLWNRFVEAKESFWKERQAITDAKQKEWEAKKKSFAQKKKKQVNDLYEQIGHLKDSIHNSLDINKVTRVNGWIEEKQAIINALKKEIKELEEK